MEELLTKVSVVVLAYYAIKFYWDRRDLENQLYVSEHTFLNEVNLNKSDDPTQWFEGDKLTSVRSKKAKK